jgi:hypothetical protein
VTEVGVELKEKRVWVSCGAEVSPQQVVGAIESAGKFRAKFLDR